jgi:hypothetical protein
MSCQHCRAPEILRDEARVASLEKQNTDLITIVGNLLKDRLMFRFVVDDAQRALRPEEYARYFMADVENNAKRGIEGMLEERRSLYEELALLLLHADSSYYHALNGLIFKRG